MMTYLFDWDNTLMSIEIYKKIYPKFISYITKKYNKTESELYNEVKSKVRLYQNNKMDSGELAKELGEFDYYYKILKEEAQNKNYLFHDTVNTIQGLRDSGHKIGIVTNSFRKTIEVYLETYNLKVDFIFSSENADCKKSNPLFWKKLIKKYDLDPKECLVEGDDEIEDYGIPLEQGFNTKLISR